MTGAIGDPAEDAPASGLTGTLDAPAALPARRVGGGWIALIALANLGLYLGFFGPLQVLLPNQVQAIAGSGDKVAMLGWVTALGAAAAMIAQPIAGALSDRTTSRLGRRHPWTIGGAVIGGLALVLLAFQHSIVGVAVFWVVAQAGLNAMNASLNAAIPDQVPVSQRGAVSGWIGIPQAGGVVVAVALVTVVVTGDPGYVLIGVLAIACALPFALRTSDPPLARDARPSFKWREFGESLWVSPRRYPDFAWAWVTRFLVYLGNAMAILYLLYFLQDKIHYKDPETGLLLLIVFYTLAVFLTTVIGGIISDRSGHRKIHVTVSGLVMAVPAVMLAIWPTWPVTVVSAILLGLGYGVYLSVDQALVTQVLPSAKGYAKDLGIINISSAGPQVIGPAIAAPIVSSLGGYPALYLCVAVVTVLGSILVWRIRSVP
jgi:MFS family permease